MLDLKQDTKLLKLTVAGSANTFAAVMASGTESLSTPFDYSVQAISTEKSVSPENVLGKKAKLEVQLPNGKQSFIHGIVTAFKYLGRKTQQEVNHFEVKIAPALSLLHLSENCRIFQDKTTQEIVSTILKEHQINSFSFGLVSKSLDKREYCVQYNETDLHFITRILQEEGIFYFFSHSNSESKLNFCDIIQSLPTSTVPQIDLVSGKQSAENGFMLNSFQNHQEITSKQWEVDSYNPKKPKEEMKSLSKTQESWSINGHRDPQGYHYLGTFAKKKQSKHFSELLQLSQESLKTSFYANGNCPLLSPGMQFKLTSEADNQYKGQSVATYSLSIQYADPSYTSANDSSHSPLNVNCNYILIPKKSSFVPLTPLRQHHMLGPQTAKVHCEEERDIQVDKLGRVKVEFFWDRRDKSDNKTCWLRVSQSMAGNNWGFQFIPRHNQEVIVSFINGNPDQPIITGVVYNGDNNLPYKLPENKTQSGIKTRSTPNGSDDNYNEIKFEDKKGEEFFNVQAEKDFNRLVKNNETITVKANRTLTTHKNETHVIKQNETHTVEQNRTTLIKENDSTTVEKDKTTIVTGNHTTQVKGQTSLKSQGNITVRSDQNVSQSSGQAFDIKAGTALSISAATQISISVGNSGIEMDAAGNIKITGTKIELEAAQIQGTGATLVKLEAPAIKLN